MSLETKILLIITIVDCIVTSILFSLGLLIEINPFMNLLLMRSIWVFIIIKMMISIPLILVLELLRKGKLKNFVKNGQRVAIVGYLGMILIPNFILMVI